MLERLDFFPDDCLQIDEVFATSILSQRLLDRFHKSLTIDWQVFRLDRVLRVAAILHELSFTVR